MQLSAIQYILCLDFWNMFRDLTLTPSSATKIQCTWVLFIHVQRPQEQFNAFPQWSFWVVLNYVDNIIWWPLFAVNLYREIYYEIIIVNIPCLWCRLIPNIRATWNLRSSSSCFIHQITAEIQQIQYVMDFGYPVMRCAIASHTQPKLHCESVCNRPPGTLVCSTRLHVQRFLVAGVCSQDT